MESVRERNKVERERGSWRFRVCLSWTSRVYLIHPLAPRSQCTCRTEDLHPPPFPATLYSIGDSCGTAFWQQYRSVLTVPIRNLATCCGKSASGDVSG